MSYVRLTIRFILGAIFFIFGLNKFLGFMPTPPLEGSAATFMTGLAATGYFFPLLGSTELIAGALLMLGVYVRLALLFLAPVIVNIVLFHLFLAPEGLPLGILVLFMEVYLAWMHRDHFKDDLEIK